MNDLLLIGGEATPELGADVAGAKAANLSRMAAMGLPVPPAFVIPTSLCAAISAGDRDAGRRLDRALAQGIAWLEERMDRGFGDRRRPLLVSVRSGAARSMPGMLETVLNIGCTADAIQGLVRLTGNPRFAWDCRRRFLEGFGEVLLGLAPNVVGDALAGLVRGQGVASERDLDSLALMQLSETYARLIEAHRSETGQTAMGQLQAAARAVFASWTSDKAQTYRRLQGFEDLAGTAVCVQAMVFGNADARSGSGVAFSRDPSTGQQRQVVELLFEAQGEDVVSGRRTPVTGDILRARHPELLAELSAALEKLEHAFADVQDIEFTIERGKFWLLQTRAAKRTPRAALRIAIDLVAQGLISPGQALARLGDLDMEALRLTRLQQPPAADGRGLGASPGVACGRAAFDSDSAVARAANGEPVILLRPDTSTADIAGFSAAAGVVTSSGGRTAHAALVARQLGRPCVVGCAELRIDLAKRQADLAGRTLAEGDWVAIDGEAGEVYIGRLEILSQLPEAEIAIWQGWRDAQVRA